MAAKTQIGSLRPCRQWRCVDIVFTIIIPKIRGQYRWRIRLMQLESGGYIDWINGVCMSLPQGHLMVCAVLAAKNRCMQVHRFNLDQDGSRCVAQLYMLCFSAEMSCA